jgi:hypothetical protein
LIQNDRFAAWVAFNPRHGEILFVDPNLSLEETFVGALWRGAQDVAGMRPHFVLANQL